MEFQNVYEKRVGIAYVTVNRPKVRNALDQAFIEKRVPKFEGR